MREILSQRPSPDALLEQVRNRRRGKLKIFLGAAPGVGKTYEMLQQAHQRLRDGVDVVIGVVESHGRVDTQALTEGLEVIPRKQVSYQGQSLDEMDIDAIIRRRPQLALVDELAHTNIEGSRHPKRYMDVDELLNAGIDVYTTVNVQHIESLNDVVAQITHVRVRETVSDRILDGADELELVDTTADDLIHRLKAGKIYAYEQAGRALQNFFTPGNLIALRELALRKAAQQVDRGMVGYMQANAISGPWPAGEHILLCVNEHPSSAELVRRAKRLADGMRAAWTAVYVESLRHATLSEVQRDRIADTLRLAQQLGAETITLTGNDIAQTLLSYARQNNITQIVTGKTERPRWFEFLQGSVARDLISESGPVGVHIISAKGDAVPGKTVRTAKLPDPNLWRGYGWSLAAVALSVIVAQGLDQLIGFRNLNLVFLVPVLFSAVSYGLRPALATSFASVMAYNFFFLPPLYTFTVGDPDNVLSLIILFIVAVIASNLTARIRVQADIAASRARIASELYSFTGKLAGIAQLDDILWAASFQMATMLNGSVVLLLPDPVSKRPVIHAGFPPEDQLDDQDIAAAAWCWEHGRPAGRNSDTLPGARRLFLPMRTAQGLVGVVGLQLREEKSLLTPDERRLMDALIDQTALAVERSQLVGQIEEARVYEQADKLRVAMLASLSHDLRTPLASILGATTSLRAFPDSYNGAQREELLATVQEEAERLDRFVNNLLDMSRLEAGVLGAKSEPTDISEIIDSALKRLARLLKVNHVVRDIPHDLPLVMADPLLLEQALVNLLDNAAKFAPTGSTIRIAAVPKSEKMLVRVEDEGSGIPDAELPFIFDKFYRAKSGDQKIAGTGLGLAVAKGFVEAMRGRLEAGHRAAGTGAVFTIELQIVQRESGSDV